MLSKSVIAWSLGPLICFEPDGSYRLSITDNSLSSEYAGGEEVPFLEALKPIKLDCCSYHYEFEIQSNAEVYIGLKAGNKRFYYDSSKGNTVHTGVAITKVDSVTKIKIVNGDIVGCQLKKIDELPYHTVNFTVNGTNVGDQAYIDLSLMFRPFIEFQKSNEEGKIRANFGQADFKFKEKGKNVVS